MSLMMWWTKNYRLFVYALRSCHLTFECEYMMYINFNRKKKYCRSSMQDYRTESMSEALTWTTDVMCIIITRPRVLCNMIPMAYEYLWSKIFCKFWIWQVANENNSQITDGKIRTKISQYNRFWSDCFIICNKYNTKLSSFIECRGQDIKPYTDLKNAFRKQKAW